MDLTGQAGGVPCTGAPGGAFDQLAYAACPEPAQGDRRRGRSQIVEEAAELLASRLGVPHRSQDPQGSGVGAAGEIGQEGDGGGVGPVEVVDGKQQWTGGGRG